MIPWPKLTSPAGVVDAWATLRRIVARLDEYALEWLELAAAPPVFSPVVGMFVSAAAPRPPHGQLCDELRKLADLPAQAVRFDVHTVAWFAAPVLDP